MKTRRKSRTSPNHAIVYLLFKSESYLIGACISGYIHQQFRKKYNLKFDLIVMVDEALYKYKKELELFFDQIRLIDLIPIKLSESYSKLITPRYTNTMPLFTTKLNVFQLHEYKKVLFIDIDIIPVHKDFYSIFNYTTPAFLFNHLNKKIKHAATYTKKQIYSKLTDLSIQSNFVNLTIGGGLFLISPTKGEFEEIISFMHTCEGKTGYTSVQLTNGFYSGPDETIMLHYFALKKEIPITSIHHKYRTVPYYSMVAFNNLAYDYMSDIKPFNKPLFMMWKEEFIFYFLAEQVIKESVILQRVHYRNIAKIVSDYYKSAKEATVSARCSKVATIKEICFSAISTLDTPTLRTFLTESTSYDTYKLMKKEIETILKTVYDNLNDTSKLDLSTYGRIDKQLQLFYKSVL